MRVHVDAVALLVRHLSERVFVLTRMELKYYKRVVLIVKEIACASAPLTPTYSGEPENNRDRVRALLTIT